MPNKTVMAYNIDELGDERQKRICLYPEVTECPVCHHALSPKVLSAHYSIDNGNDDRTRYLHLTCFCQNCRTTFLCVYYGLITRYNPDELTFVKLCSISPSTPVLASYSDAIKKLSPGFVETYAQAEFAESKRLFQICGSGYRKALEILVKDYLCHIHPGDTEKIRSELLGASINRIENNRIKTLAQRSTWIGNDETHYVRKHEDLGLPEMKRFIKAMLTYIDSELAFEEAESISAK